jgi:hypothetical protein
MRFASMLCCVCAVMCVGLLSSRQCSGQPLLPPGWGSQSPKPWPVLHESRFAFYLPAPISSQEIDRYAAILVLSEPQRQYLNTLLVSYTERISEIERRRGAELLHAAEPINERAAAQDFRTTPESVDEFEQVHAAEGRLIRDLVREDEALLAELATILAEPQRDLMHRVQLHRERSRCVTNNFMLVISRIDLSHMVVQWEKAAEILPEIEEFLWEYELRITPAIVRAAKAHRKSRTEHPRLTASISFDEFGLPVERDSPEAAERFRVFRARMEQNWRANTEAELRIIRINQETLPQLLERMDPDLAKEFHAAYLTLCYRRVSPDPLSPEVLFDKLAASEETGPGLAQELQALWAEYSQKYEALNASLRAEIDQRREFRSLQWSSTGWREHETAMERLLQARINLNEAIIERVILLLPEQLQRQHAKDIEAWRHRLVQYRDSPASKARESSVAD